MRRHEGTRLARFARRLGVDRNPLRRRTDRIEAVIRLATTILLLAAVPLAMITVARWQPPGQVPRTGQVPAPAGAGPGRTVSVWLNASGAVTSPPPDHQTIVANAFIAAIWTGLVMILLVLGASALTRRVLDRQRMRAWDAEWRATGPRWSDHRS